ncbi:MAG: peptide chain release factor N(5)-glutamine methyltransferase [Rhizobiaceae bacterium]
MSRLQGAVARYCDVHRQGLTKLEAAGKASASHDARLLLQHVSGLEHSALISRWLDLCPEETRREFAELVERRVGGEPVFRIMGQREFYGLGFTVTPAVLDPRPDTELLVDRVLNAYRGRPGPLRFADIGTGSGAIAVAILANLANVHCVASDISAEALEVARANSVANGVGARMETRSGDCLQSLDGTFDFIVSNPPYIASSEIGALEPEVRLHDPLAALDGGTDGLDFYRVLLREAGAFLKPDGRLFMEFGIGQALVIADLAARHDWHLPEVFRDLAGIERVMVLSAPG